MCYTEGCIDLFTEDSDLKTLRFHWDGSSVPPRVALAVTNGRRGLCGTTSQDGSGAGQSWEKCPDATFGGKIF